jgi:hypothetical protein
MARTMDRPATGHPAGRQVFLHKHTAISAAQADGLFYLARPHSLRANTRLLPSSQNKTNSMNQLWQTIPLFKHHAQKKHRRMEANLNPFLPRALNNTLANGPHIISSLVWWRRESNRCPLTCEQSINSKQHLKLLLDNRCFILSSRNRHMPVPASQSSF